MVNMAEIKYNGTMKSTSEAGSKINSIEEYQQEIERLRKLVDFLDADKQALQSDKQTLEIQTAQAKTENLQLSANNQVLQEALLLANKERDNLAAKLKSFMEQLALARKQQFGSSSEQIDAQINLFNECESEADPKAEEPTEETIVAANQRKKPAHARATMNDDLPSETVTHEPSPEDLACPTCGNVMSVMAWREFVELVFVPAVIKRVVHLYPVLYCKACRASDENATIVEPERPAALLPKTMASASIVSHIITQKFMMALPLYRQEQEWEQLGIRLSRQTQSNWLLAVSEKYLQPLRNRMYQHLLERDILFADETRLQVLKEPGRAAETKSFMWVYLTGGQGPPVILYDYQTTRAAKHPQAFLGKFKGFCHSDGYSGYHDLRDITIVGCWAHARRRFHKAIQVIPEAKRTKDLPSVIGMDFCERLYAIEKSLREVSPEERFAKRKEMSVPILVEFKTWLKAIRPSVLSTGLLGDAVKYCLNQWPYLENYILDGQLEIDNNRAERACKSFVIGRKNWLFSNTPGGAKSSAAIYSIVRTALANGLRVEAYLRWLFERVPTIDINDAAELDALMPWSPAVPEECRMTPAERETAEAKLDKD
jgi:transposase